MSRRLLIIVAMLGLLGYGGLLLIQWQFGMGRFAKSPQQILLAAGGRVIGGGGRAVVGLAEVADDTARVEIRCADVEHEAELAREELSDEVCGVRVRWLGTTGEVTLSDGTRVPGQVVEITWE